MINIFHDLQDLTLPVYQEGDAPEILPDEYYTVNEDYSTGNLYADNDEKEIRYEYTLRFYTKNAGNLRAGLTTAMDLLKSKGYIVSGAGYHAPSYHDTWNCRQADIEKIEYL